MPKSLNFLLIFLAILFFGIGCSKLGPKAEDASPSEITVNLPKGEVSMLEAVVDYTDKGFNPPLIRIIAGTKITFVNKNKIGVHPVLDGDQAVCADFGSAKALKKGESYSYTFEQAGECHYRNQLAKEEKGVVDVRAIE